MLVVPGHERVGIAALVRNEEEAIFRHGSVEEKASALRRRSPLLADCSVFPRSGHFYKLWRAHAERYVERGAALIGDAVHVTNPVACQGMTMAVLDAAHLASFVRPLLAVRV